MSFLFLKSLFYDWILGGFWWNYRQSRIAKQRKKNGIIIASESQSSKKKSYGIWSNFLHCEFQFFPQWWIFRLTFPSNWWVNARKILRAKLQTQAYGSNDYHAVLSTNVFYSWLSNIFIQSLSLKESKYPPHRELEECFWITLTQQQSRFVSTINAEDRGQRVRSKL